MGTKQFFNLCLDSASKAIAMVKPADYSKPTPDTEWDVKTLAGHMLYELAWVTDIVEGKTIAEVGDKYDGDLIGGKSLAELWRQAEASARQAVESCDLQATAHLSWKDTTNDYYLKQEAKDQLIHAWDLSAALGNPVKFDVSAAQAAYDNIYPTKDQLSSSGMFAPEIKVSPDSDLQTRLLAIYGRDSSWKP